MLRQPGRRPSRLGAIAHHSARQRVHGLAPQGDGPQIRSNRPCPSASSSCIPRCSPCRRSTRRSRRCGPTRRSQRARRVALQRHSAGRHARAGNLHAADQPLPPLRAERRRRHRVLRLDLRAGGRGGAQGRQDPGAAHRGGDDGRGGRARRPILIVCTQKRAQPVVRGTLEAAAKQAGKPLKITELWVSGARDALNKGDNDTHDRLIAEQIGGGRRVRPDRVRHDVDGAGEGEDAARARAQGADQRRGRGRAHAQADGSMTMPAVARSHSTVHCGAASSRSLRPPPRRISTRASSQHPGRRHRRRRHRHRRAHHVAPSRQVYPGQSRPWWRS